MDRNVAQCIQMIKVINLLIFKDSKTFSLLLSASFRISLKIVGQAKWIVLKTKGCKSKSTSNIYFTTNWFNFTCKMSRTGQPPIADFHGSYESSCGYCKEKNQVTGRLERKAKGRQCVGMHAYNLYVIACEFDS
jgi:hypothetical protein